MRDKPFIVSLLIALIVVLVIAGVSLVVKMNKVQVDYKSEIAKKMTVQKELEETKAVSKKAVAEKDALYTKMKALDEDLADSKNEFNKLEKLKEKLEENLKDELIKQDRISKKPIEAEAKEDDVKAIGEKALEVK